MASDGKNDGQFVIHSHLSSLWTISFLQCIHFSLMQETMILAIAATTRMIDWINKCTLVKKAACGTYPLFKCMCWYAR
jgi:hypothetical protein